MKRCFWFGPKHVFATLFPRDRFPVESDPSIGPVGFSEASTSAEAANICGALPPKEIVVALAS